MTRNAIGRLHVITDTIVQERFTHLELAVLALAGGADSVQFREKRPRTTAALVQTAAELLARARSHGARLIIDDRVDVAVASGADGVHLGRDDLDVRVARGMLGERLVIGATANRLDEALVLATQPIDYLGVGPVFRTSSKQDPAPAIGLDALSRIVESTSCPVIAIGGITPERVRSVLATGVHGIAVLSAVACAGDPAREAARFRTAINDYVAEAACEPGQPDRRTG